MKQKSDYIDLTNLNWKFGGRTYISEAIHDGVKYFYKLPYYKEEKKQFVGHEPCNEVIVSRLLDILGIEHANYLLTPAKILFKNCITDVIACRSENILSKDEKLIPIESWYNDNKFNNESKFEFFNRIGIIKEIFQMIFVDYLIMNRDRTKENIFMIIDKKANEYRMAPLFDHGISLLYNCWNEEEIKIFDIKNEEFSLLYVGAFTNKSALKYLEKKKVYLKQELNLCHKDLIFNGLDKYISPTHIDKSWNMLWERWNYVLSCDTIGLTFDSKKNKRKQTKSFITTIS